jgi:hypothetical protein
MEVNYKFKISAFVHPINPQVLPISYFNLIGRWHFLIEKLNGQLVE